MTEFSVKSADISWLRIPFENPIADATHTIAVSDLIVLELTDRAGCRGTGYMLGFDYATAVLFEIACDAARVAIGTDTRMRNQTWQTLWNRYEYVGRQGVAAWGVAIVDLALWDLYGNQAEQPVWALVGGARPSTPAYGSGGWLTMSEREMIAEAERYLRRGLRGYKMKVGHGISEDLVRVRALREALGQDVALMIDANQGYDLASARRLSDALEGLDIRWFEEPMPTTNVHNYRCLRESTNIPIAVGERAYYPEGIAEIIAAGGVDVVMPDALRIGGVRGWLDLAGMVSAAGLQVSPHYYREFDASLAAATPASVFVENFFWTDPIFDWQARYHDGRVSPPEAPGFGLRLKDDARATYLRKHKALSHDDRHGAN